MMRMTKWRERKREGGKGEKQVLRGKRGRGNEECRESLPV